MYLTNINVLHVFRPKPEVGWVELSYEQAAVIPARCGEGSEQTQYDYHEDFRVDDVEQKH